MSYGRILLVCASITVVVGTFLALSLPAPYWWLVPLALLLAYQGLIVWGVLDLRLNMFARCIYQVSGQLNKIALTFDDGPDPISTPLVLQALRNSNAKATFFVIGKKVERYPELIRQIAADGHDLAVHSHGHELTYAFLSPAFVSRDIARCRELIEQCGVSCSDFFRPPVGQASPRTALGIQRAHVRYIGWSARGGDGVRRRTIEQCLARVTRGLRGGAIILLHDAWQAGSLEDDAAAVAANAAGTILEHCPAGVGALPQLLLQLDEQDYRSVTLTELLDQPSST